MDQKQQQNCKELYEQFKLFKFKQSDQNELYNLFEKSCKSENGSLKLIEWFIIINDKGLMKNGFGLKFFFEKYNIAMAEDVQEIKTQQKQQQVTKKNEQQKKAQEEEKQKEEKLKEENKHKFHKYKFLYLVFICGIEMYKGQKYPVEEFIKFVNYDYAVLKRKQTTGQVSSKDPFIFRQIQYNEETIKKILSDQAISCFIEFERDFKNIFTFYMPENLETFQKDGSLMLNWEEISLLNKRMSTIAFLKMLQDQNIYPQVVEKNYLEDAIVKLIPAVGNRENNFYNYKLQIIFEKELTKKQLTNILQIQGDYEGDPQISFYEFYLIIAKIALDTTMKEAQKKDVFLPIKTFFHDTLQIRQNSDQTLNIYEMNGKDFGQYILKQLQPNKKNNQKKQQVEQVQQQEIEYQSGDHLLERQLENSKFRHEDKPNLDFKLIMKQLDEELPQIPQQKEIKQDWPPPFCYQKPLKERHLDYIVLGEGPPKDSQKGQQKKQDKKNPEKKVEGIREIKWEGYPKAPPKSSLQCQIEYEQQQNYQSDDLNNIKRGVMSSIIVIPVIIDEVIYPIDCPLEAQKFLEASFNSFVEVDYARAFVNIEQCLSVWQNIDEENCYKIYNQLFFEIFKGLIYFSAGRDDMAIFIFFNSRPLSKKLDFSNPDRALPYSCLGNVFYRMEEYEMALRCYQEARKWREDTIGGDTIETATIYNNLGCCMNMLERNEEALVYYSLAHAIFDLELGPYQQRTLTAARNKQKCKQTWMDYTPKFEKPWVIYEKDPYAKQKAVKTVKKK